MEYVTTSVYSRDTTYYIHDAEVYEKASGENTF